MPKANLTKEAIEVLQGMDGIIIRKYIYGIEAGRVLDNTDYNYDVVPCGTPIITKLINNEQVYKALVPTEGYVIPSGWSVAGLASATVRNGQACPIIINGVVNEVALLANMKKVFPTPNRVLTIEDLAVIKSALPHIIFMSDECSDSARVISDVVYIYDETTWNANFNKLADYYAKNPEAAGHDGTYPNVKWVVANFNGLSGTMSVIYNGDVKTTIPGITAASTYVIIDPLGDLNIPYSSFDVTKLVLSVKA